MFHVRIEGQALRACLSDCESVTATGSGHDADTVNLFLGAPWQHQPSSPISNRTGFVCPAGIKQECRPATTANRKGHKAPCRIVKS